jgi:hypothetical protein
VDEPSNLRWTANQDAIVDFYRKSLAAGWKSMMDKMVDVDEKPTMIFRNPAKEMPPMDYRRASQVLASVRFRAEKSPNSIAE